MDDSTPRRFGRRQYPVQTEGEALPPAASGNPAARQSKLAALLKQRWDRRDGRWNHEFITEVPKASFLELYPQIMSPEGHRAYAVTVVEDGAPNAMNFPNLVKKVTKVGYALALFTGAGMEPDFVFKHGQLTPFIAHKALLPLNTRPAGIAGEDAIPEGTPYLLSNPSHTVLPEATRGALREWLERRYGITGVSICLRMDMVSPEEVVKTLGVDFGRKPPPDDVLRDVMLGIYWYLPPDIAAGIFHDMGSEESFHPL